MQEKFNDWVPFPRQIALDFIEGRIPPAEYLLLCALRGRVDPFGVIRTSLSDIKYDVFKGKGSENYVNKLLLSLKNSHYLFFKNRKGHKGSFNIDFGDLTPPKSGNIKNLEPLFKAEEIKKEKEVTSPDDLQARDEPTLSQRLEPSSQRSQELIDDIFKVLKGSSFDDSLRGNDTETDT